MITWYDIFKELGEQPFDVRLEQSISRGTLAKDFKELEVIATSIGCT